MFKKLAVLLFLSCLLSISALTAAAAEADPLKEIYELLDHGDYKEADTEASKFANGPQALDVKIIRARAKSGEGDTEGALKFLDASQFPADWSAAVQYWRAVVHFDAGEIELARQEFQKVLDTTQNQHWAHAESKGWLDRISNDTRLFRFQASLSYAYDGNAAQSGGSSMNGAAQGGGDQGGGGQGGQNGGGGQAGGQPGAPGGPGGANYAPQTATSVPDTGPSVDLLLTLRPLQDGKGSYLEASLGTYESFYLLYPSYDYETFTAKLYGEWAVSKSFRFNGGLSYLDSRYYFSYYQDYLTPSLGASWDILHNLTASLRNNFQINMLTRSGFAYSPTVSVDWNWWMETWAGFNFSYAKGQQGVVSVTNPPTLVSGTMFSNYTSYGPYIGASRVLFWGIELSINGSLSLVSYPLDVLPPSAGNPTARFDTVWAASASLSRFFFNGRFKVGINGQYTVDNSTGFSGIPTSSGLPINSYTRPYVSVVTGVYL